MTLFRRMLESKPSRKVRSLNESCHSDSAFLTTVHVLALNILRMIKLFGWESKINKRISDKRADELRLIRRGQLLALLSRSLKYAYLLFHHLSF